MAEYLQTGISRHSINALKYATALPVSFSWMYLSYLARFYTNAKSTDNASYRMENTILAWVFFNLLNSTFSLIWDICVDWYKLFLKNRQLPRKRIHFRRWTYILSTILNIILRYIWILKISVIYNVVDSFVTSGHVEVKVKQLQSLEFFLIACELVRRWVWVFFRLEREWVLQI
jgi:hypothetical protein